MEPEIWGPSTWLFLHTVTYNYPKEPTIIDRNNYHDFFTSLQNVLPCPTCQKHYMMHLSKYPIQLQSRKHLVEWLLNVHNAVNIIVLKLCCTFAVTTCLRYLVNDF